MAPVTLRGATLDDAAFLYALRSDPAVRAASFAPPPESLAAHTAWLATVLHTESVVLHVIERDGVAIGMVRLDGTQRPAELSIALVAEAVGQGIGSAVIARVTTAFGGVVAARIKPENALSRRAFAKAGYAERYVVMEYPP